MNGSFPDFKDIEFPKTPDIVYILYFRRKNNSFEIPFYIGESSRNIGRIGDYISAKFSAPTDYKVGEAIKYIRSFDFFVGVKYKETQRRKEEEKQIRDTLRKHYRLLNDLSGFNYTKSERAKEKLKIHEFVREIIHFSSETRQEHKNEIGGVTTQDQSMMGSKIANGKNIPKIIESICEELGAGGKVILHREIINRAKQYGINETSVLPADYCDNTITGRWSKHNFLHSLGPGRYILLRFKNQK